MYNGFHTVHEISNINTYSDKLYTLYTMNNTNTFKCHHFLAMVQGSLFEC